MSPRSSLLLGCLLASLCLLAPDTAAVEPTVALGVERARLADITAARTIFEELIALDPHDTVARLQLIQLYQKMDPVPVEQLEIELRELQRVDSVSSTATLLLAMVLRDASQLDRAEAVVQAGLESFPEDPKLLQILGTVRVARGEHDPGLRLLTQAAEANPGDPSIQRDLALGLLRAGQGGAALMKLTEVRDHYPKDLEVHRALSEIYAKIGDDKRAEDEKKQVELLEEVEARKRRRFQHFRKLSEKIQELEKAAGGDSPADGTFTELWSLYDLRGDMEWNLARLEPLARAHPESIEAQAAAGLVLLERGDMAGKEALLEVLKTVPDQELALSTLFFRLGTRMELDRLLELGRTAVEEAPDSAIAHLYLGRALLANKRTEGRRELERALKLDPANLDALMRLSYEEMKLRNAAKVESLLARAQKVGPESPRVYMALGQVAMRRGNGPEAYEHFTMAEDLGGRNQMLYWHLGTLSKGMGRTEDSRHYWDLAQRLLPKNRDLAY